MLKISIMVTVGLSFFIIAWFNLFTVTENRVVEPFTSISVEGPIQAFLVKGLGDTVRLVADNNLPRVISTKVVDQKLIIAPTEDIRHERVLKVYASMESLHSIEVHGSATLDITEKINVDALDITLSGSAEARILAECRDLQIMMRGAWQAAIALLTSIHLRKVRESFAFQFLTHSG